MTTLERSVEEAVTSADDIRWVRAYLRGLLDGGRERTELEGTLERVYKHLQELDNEPAADLALEGLDFLTGWCGPGMEIPEPHSA